LDAKTIWLFVFVGLYWTYCLFWGIKGALVSRTATDYMIAGRRLGVWVFVLAATATSFSGWTFIGHPGSIYDYGFQYAIASFYAITIPLTGVLFLKRQWMLGKRYGFVTPGEMLAAYFKSDTLRLLTVLVALIFSIPYIGVQLRASGFLFNVLTNGAMSIEAGMWLMSAVVAIYVAAGGLRAVAYVDTAQCILLALGIAVLGLVALYYIPDLVGGIKALSQLDKTGPTMAGQRTPDGYSAYIAIPGAIQFVSSGLDAVGGPWTGMMILTYMFALMGIQSAPAFSMWAFANRSPAPFPHQQVWASSLGIGLILFIFTTIQGVGGHFLGADLQFYKAHPELTNPVLAPGLISLNDPTVTPAEARAIAAEGLQALDAGRMVDLMATPARDENLVPELIGLLGDTLPWMVGLLAVCALAAMQSTASAYMSTAGSMLTRDILRRYVIPKANDLQQKAWGRLGSFIIVLAALIVATTSAEALVLLGGLAVAYGLQMWPALIGVCWWPWLTRQGVVAGLIGGVVAVTLTDFAGPTLFRWLGVEPPWGRWPLTIYSAGWGIFANLSLAVLVSAFTQNQRETIHRLQYHSFLREHAGLGGRKRRLIPVAWAITLLWFMLAIGPGAVIGNWIFGDPNRPDTWLFGLPSLWTWQLLFWLLGVGLMWFLAFKMELSTVPDREIEELIGTPGHLRLVGR
jgi:Na+/proline symporter